MKLRRRTGSLSDLEHLRNAFYACYKRINLFLGVVQGEACTNGSQDAITVHQRLSTVMTCTNGDAQAVEQGSHIHMMNITNQEADNGIFALLFTKKSDTSSTPSSLFTLNEAEIGLRDVFEKKVSFTNRIIE